jgi:murein DD-endopeptidase MepM/ murein hydrolase activator NlpD
MLAMLLLGASTHAVADVIGEPAEGCRVMAAQDAATASPAGDPVVFPPPQLQIRTPVAPSAIPSAGRHYLIYELHLQNFSDVAMKLQRLDVVTADTQPSVSLAAFQGDELEALLSVYGSEASAGSDDAGVSLPAGGSAITYLCLAFEDAARLPERLSHRIGMSGTVAHGPTIEVARAPLRVLAPPVAGADWTAAGGPSNTSHHRRGPIVVEGASRISRRFALDWKRLKDNASFEGDPLDVRAYHAYGHDVLAVADARVVSVMDGLPDNVPRTAAGFSPALPLTMSNVAGNHVVLDLGEGYFAYYAHLQPGSVSVHVGDSVQRGQVLGRIGNSGDSREPHLHFQLTDAPRLLDAEGLPHVIDRYRVRAGSATYERTNELPVRGMLIDFEPADRR